MGGEHSQIATGLYSIGKLRILLLTHLTELGQVMDAGDWFDTLGYQVAL